MPRPGAAGVTVPFAHDDWRAAARRRLPRFLFDYVEGGATDEVTLRRNREALHAVSLRQRLLPESAPTTLACTLFGESWAMPVGLGPIGLAGMYARRGEAQAARAASAAGVPLCLSTAAVCSYAEVNARSARPPWFQLYMMHDKALAREILASVKESGCTVLTLTVDLALYGIRYREYRSGMAGPRGWRATLRRAGQLLARPGWTIDVGLAGRPHRFGSIAPFLPEGSSFANLSRVVQRGDLPTVSWRDVEWLRGEWDGPLILKGVLDPEEARIAVAAGADGIVVSNHGGRQLDGAIGTAQALPPIVDAVAGGATILADGGVRTGIDVLRMLALGADGVLLGRAWAHALAGGGGAGVHALLKRIAQELHVGLALTGCTSLEDVGPALLAGKG